MGAWTFKQKTSEEGTRIFSGTTQLYYTTRNLLWAGLKSHLHLLQKKNNSETNSCMLVNFNTVLKVIWITGAVNILDLDKPARC